MQTTKYIRKGQVQGAVVSIILLIVGAAVATMILIFTGALGGRLYENVEADIESFGNNVVVREALTPLNDTVQNFGHSFIQTGTLDIFNTTSGVSITGNFTINYDYGTFKLTNALYNNSADFVANYTWGVGEVSKSIKSGIVSGFEAVSDSGDYLSIVILAVIITVVLGLVLGLLAITNMGIGGNGRNMAL